MSLILDALKRSEKERTAQESSLPDIFSEDAKSGNNRKHNLLKKLILPLIIILNLAMLAYVLLPGLDSPNNSTKPEHTDTTAIISEKNESLDKPQQTKPVPAVTIKQEPGTIEPARTSNTQANLQADPLISQLPKANVPAQKPLIQALPKVVTKPKPVKTPIQQSVNNINTEKNINTSADHTPDIKDTKNEDTAENEDAAENNFKDADEIKTVAELQNDNLSNSLASYEINTHIYSSNPDRSFVLINMKKYREGQTLSGSNYKIDSITAKGVVIDHGNGLVLLKAR